MGGNVSNAGMSGTQSTSPRDVPSVSGEPGTERVSAVECPCGMKFQISQSGIGYEEFHQHMMEEQKSAQWGEVYDRIKVSASTVREF
jgi:hypothetical protein